MISYSSDGQQITTRPNPVAAAAEPLRTPFLVVLRPQERLMPMISPLLSRRRLTEANPGSSVQMLILLRFFAGAKQQEGPGSRVQNQNQNHRYLIAYPRFDTTSCSPQEKNKRSNLGTSSSVPERSQCSKCGKIPPARDEAHDAACTAHIRPLSTTITLL